MPGGRRHRHLCGKGLLVGGPLVLGAIGSQCSLQSFVQPSTGSNSAVANRLPKGHPSTASKAAPSTAAASSVSAAGLACATATAAAALAAGSARRHKAKPQTVREANPFMKMGGSPGPATPTATGDVWLPRYEGWSTAELAAERARALTLEEPGSYSGPRYRSASDITESWIKDLIQMQKNGTLLPKKDVYLMMLDVIDILRSETTMGKVAIPAGKHLTVVGDLHGQYWDFTNILDLAGLPSASAPFLFNGDYVDRGSWGIEVIMVIFAFKLKDPNSVFLNRGNHEMLETNILYGFCGECGVKYDMPLFNLFSEAFRNLPLCQLVEDKVLVLHGGLPGPDPRIWIPGQTHDPTDSVPMGVLPTLQDIAATDRYMEITPNSYANSIGPTTTDKEANDVRKVIDILWSDPRGGDGYGPSYRKGKGVFMFGPDVTKTFCEKNGLQCIVRSHEVKAEGYRWDHQQLLSVFSAPNYLDTGNNKGAFLKLRKSSTGTIEFEPVTYSAVAHPDIPPMKWQEHISENYNHLTRIMRKKVGAASFDEFGDSDFQGLMNFDEWEPDEADSFQDAFRVDAYGRPLTGAEIDEGCR
eukprot:TRINITY_DN11830_c2_g1_i1.p1 TRINITY_DN11830_c2_g1~~TRINITY_DN11830_c2_g1_i1.p1  ORF type:complete len:584 (-),score=120.17 TRINITY_DN11830_c2_g1_i1:242-1993(-)